MDRETFVDQVEMTAECAREAGWVVSIDYGLPSVGITSDNEKWFFQEHEAQALLDEVPDDLRAEDYILWTVQSW